MYFTFARNRNWTNSWSVKKLLALKPRVWASEYFRIHNILFVGVFKVLVRQVDLSNCLVRENVSRLHRSLPISYFLVMAKYWNKPYKLIHFLLTLEVQYAVPTTTEQHFPQKLSPKTTRLLKWQKFNEFKFSEI